MNERLLRLGRYALLVVAVGGFGAATIRRHIDRRADGTLAVHSDVITFVQAGSDLLHGRDLYFGPDGAKNSYVYPPFCALATIPLLVLPPLALDCAWYVLNVFLLYLIFARACRLMTGADLGSLAVRTRWMLVAASVALALRYVVRNAQDANINVLLLWLIVEGVERMERTGHEGWAALIGLAAAVKLLPGVFALYFLARRQWKALAALAGAFVLATCAPALVAGPARTWESIASFLAYGRAQLGPAGLEIENFSVWGTLGRLLTASKAFEFPDGTPVMVNVAALPPDAVRWAVAAADIGFAALLVAAARTEAPRHRGSLVIAVLVMNLLSVLTEDHHTVGFALAYFFLLLRWSAGSLPAADRWLVVVTGAASTLLSHDIVVPLLGKLAYMTLLAWGIPVLPVGLLLTWSVWRNVPRASGTW